MLTLAQRLILHADAITRPELTDAIANGDDAVTMNFYNALAAPDFIVWKTLVTKDQYQSEISSTGSQFSWSGTGGYIARSQAERDAWAAIFDNPNQAVNPSLGNVITAFNDIFSGSGAQAINNRNHLAAMSKRKATLAEKLLSSGTGSDPSPAIMSFEGFVSISEASQIRAGE